MPLKIIMRPQGSLRLSDPRAAYEAKAGARVRRSVLHRVIRAASDVKVQATFPYILTTSDIHCNQKMTNRLKLGWDEKRENSR